MPRIIGENIPERMCFTFTPQNRKDMEESMRNKDFASVAGGINTALRFYFENHDKSPIEDQIEKYLVSDRGQEYITKIMDRVDKQELKK